MIYNFEQIMDIRRAYGSSRGLISLAREQLRATIDQPPSPSYIRQIWENAGFITDEDTLHQRDKKAITIDQLDFIIQRMEMYGSLNKASTALGHSGEVVRKRLKAIGVLEQVLELEKRLK
ncbi:hypothetical protein HYX04_05830 [Candidatus Woesearchaeota archaeon]|nr:hypothetical protein [Candidatus Woesearchaeota archaeon]